MTASPSRQNSTACATLTTNVEIPETVGLLHDLSTSRDSSFLFEKIAKFREIYCIIMQSQNKANRNMSTCEGFIH